MFRIRSNRTMINLRRRGTAVQAVRLHEREKVQRTTISLYTNCEPIKHRLNLRCYSNKLSNCNIQISYESSSTASLRNPKLHRVAASVGPSMSAFSKKDFARRPNRITARNHRGRQSILRLELAASSLYPTSTAVTTT